MIQMHSHFNTSILFYSTLGEQRDLFVILAKRKKTGQGFPQSVFCFEIENIPLNRACRILISA